MCDALLVESNRTAAGMVVNSGEPAVTLAVLAGEEADWKSSLRECLGGVDALLLTNGLLPGEFDSALARKPVFELREGQWSPPELVRFVRGRLLPANSPGLTPGRV